jgi:hypothetical protein
MIDLRIRTGRCPPLFSPSKEKAAGFPLTSGTIGI